MHPFTLEFPKEFEREYHVAQTVASQRLIRIVGCAILLVIGVSQFVIWPLMGDSAVFSSGLGIFLCASLAFLALVMVGFGWAGEKAPYRFGNYITFTMAILFVMIVFAIINNLPPERHLTAFGFLHVVILTNGAIPYDWRAKGLVNFLVPTTLFLMFNSFMTHAFADFTRVMAHLTTSALVSTIVGWTLERFVRQQWVLRRALQREQNRSDQLLENILPRPIADRLRAGNTIIVENSPAVSVIFADIVGFTAFAESQPPEQVVAALNDIFSRFDAIAERLGIEKIKTIGDAYMAVAGLPDQKVDHAIAAAEMALEMRDAVTRYRLLTGIDLRVRVGINSGPVLAGVIGRKKFLYDLWGDTVNVASRMESHGIQDAVQVSESTFRLIEDHFLLELRGQIEIKGKGKMKTWILHRPLMAGDRNDAVA